MRKRIRSGFTLVEILIVVVILGILAAIVVPQFTSASNEAIKGALQSQLQTVSSQIELFRVREQGKYPDFDTNGWDELVTDEYLKEEPINGYTGETAIGVAGADVAAAGDRDSATGWEWDDGFAQIFATGFDPINDLLFHEDDYDAAWTDDIPGAAP